MARGVRQVGKEGKRGVDRDCNCDCVTSGTWNVSSVRMSRHARSPPSWHESFASNWDFAIAWNSPSRRIKPLHSKFRESVLFSAEHGKVYYFFSIFRFFYTLSSHTLSESAWGSYYLLIEGTVFVYASQHKSIFLFKARAWAWESSVKWRDEVFTNFATQTSCKKQADLTASILSAQPGGNLQTYHLLLLLLTFFRSVLHIKVSNAITFCTVHDVLSMPVSLPPSLCTYILYLHASGQTVSEISGFWTSRSVKVSFFIYLYILNRLFYVHIYLNRLFYTKIISNFNLIAVEMTKSQTWFYNLVAITFTI